MKKESNEVLILPEFQKFIKASITGRRLLPSGKKIAKGTIEQYNCTLLLLQDFEAREKEPLRVFLFYRNSVRIIQREKNYWLRFFRKFSNYLYNQKGYYDQYTGAIFKIIKTFFRYLSLDKALPVGEFYKKFRIPPESFTPAILSPSQLRFLITSKDFEKKLSKSMQRTKDIFVFGCTVALRFQDLMNLRKSNIQYTQEGTNIVLHTKKTGSEVKIPLPDYAIEIIRKYKHKSETFTLPRLSCTNLNKQIKLLMQKAGWEHSFIKIRHRQGMAVEIKTKMGQSYRFYDHITVHTMRRTAITTLLLLGVDEPSVRRISGHAPGSKEFYRYVVIVQDFLNEKVKKAHYRLLEDGTDLMQKVA